MNADELLRTQRALRRRLLDDPHAIRWKPVRDLAAEMLLHLDDPQACWHMATRWVQVKLDADRVTGGRNTGARTFYSPDFESVRASRPLPSLLGTRVSLSDPLLVKVMQSDRTVVFTDIQEERHFVQDAPDNVLQLPSIPIKLAVSVRDEKRPVAVVCVHWLDQRARVSPEHCVRLTELGNTVLGPIVAAADRLSAIDLPLAQPAFVGGWLEARLTPAELRLARLAATGMSYKEIARQLNRSFSTVDHHLRSIREKLGVSSAPKLVTLLSAELRSRRH